MAGVHRVVLVGGGFGGLYAAQAFRNAPVQLTLLDRRNFHLFQPLLYQVATGGLSPGDITAPLRAVLRKQKNTTVLMSEVVDINPATHEVITSDGAIRYDSLIVATGARHGYFGHPEWEPLAPGLKTVEDATEIRRRILIAFERAEWETDPERRREWLTFLIVGAGPTGVELAGALGEIATDTLRDDFRFIRPEQTRILILDASPRVLPQYPPDLSAKAESALIRLGVRTINGVLVTAIDERGVLVRHQGTGAVERIDARTVLWAAGVLPSPLGKVLEQRAGARLDRSGRVIVEPDLTIAGHPEIFVVGDLAHCVDRDGATPLPGVAPVAMQQGVYVAKTILSRLRGEVIEPFRYFNKGSLAVIGRASAVADFGRVRFSGPIAWLLWLFIHLMYLVGFQNRVLVFFQWGSAYLTFQRGARLITDPANRSSSEPHKEPEVRRDSRWGV